MNREYKEALAGRVEKAYSNLELQIMEDIVRRIKKTGEITSTADYQINKLQLLGNSSEDIEKMMKEALNASYPQMFELYDQVIDWEYVRNKDIYDQVNAEFVPYEDNEELQQITDGLRRQTQEELENITRTTGFALDYGKNKLVFTPLSEIYQGYLDAAMMDIVSGAFDYNSVLQKVVTQMTNSGLRTVNYASGRSFRVNVAARMAVMTGITQLTGEISEMNAEALDTDYFEVAWHANARPTHAVWQGRVYSRKELGTVCGLGTVTGLCGANCYHEYYPFVPGASERQWSDEWLEQQNRKENEPKTFKGKEYTAYEATQRQRQMETAMRAQREKVKLLEKGGADPDEIMLAKCKYQGQLQEYSAFSKKMGLKTQRDRIYLDGNGRVAPINNFNLAVAENSLRTKSGGIYGVNWKMVKSKDYTKRFDQLSDNDEANQLAATKARNALSHRTGKNTEELYAIGLNSGKDISSITNQNYKHGVRRTKKFDEDVYRAEASGDKILFIHNHPNGTTPSIVDINELLRHNNACGITVGHNGSIYYYTKPKKELRKSDLKVALMKNKSYNTSKSYEDAMYELAEKFEFEFRIL